MTGPYIPADAPLSYQLSSEVYALDGDGDCQCHQGVGASDSPSKAPGVFGFLALGFVLYLALKYK